MAGVQVAYTACNFGAFCEEVRKEMRYIHSENTKKLLQCIEDTLPERILPVEKGDDKLWRAQLGCEVRGPKDESDRPENEYPYPKARMKPLCPLYGAPEGRVNPKGIPCLYLATAQYTAICEVRPTPGSYITVARFKVLRDLKIVNCSLYHGRNNLRYNDKYEDVIWTEIDNAFSKPTTGRDNVAEYAPTQILAELFRSKGYDGIAYKSNFSPSVGGDAHNLAFFDLAVAKCLKPKLRQVKSLRLEIV